MSELVAKLAQQLDEEIVPAAEGKKDDRDRVRPNLDRLTVDVDLGDQWSNYCILGLYGETLAEGRFRTRKQEVGEFFQVLFFDNNGILMLISGLNAAALSLPELKSTAMCSNNVEGTQRRTATETSDQDQVPRDSCSALLSMAHVSTLLELRRNHPANPRWSIAMGGPDCSTEARSKEGNLELDRCGKTHFADSDDGVFNTTFWHALRVYSVPDHVTVFSLPLHMSEGTASGLFAQKDDHTYLVVRRGLTLSTYLLPERTK